MISKQLSRKINIGYGAIQFVSVASSFIMFCYVSLILKSKNFSDTEIGLAAALGSAVSVILPPLISAFYARHANLPLKRIIAFVLLVTLVFVILLILVNSPVVFVMCIFAIIVGTMISVYSLVNALAMQFENIGVPINYGLTRAVGSMGSASLGFVTGLIMEKMGGAAAALVFYAFLLCVVIVLVLTFTRPDKLGIKKPNVAKPEVPRTIVFSGVGKILKEPVCILFFLVMFFFICNQAALDTYQVNILRSHGGNDMDYGTLLLVMSACEIPLMMCFKFLIKRFSYARLLTFGFFFLIVKNVALLLSTSVAGMIAAQTLNLVSISLIVPASVYYSNAIVDKDQAVQAQALFAGTATGMGRIVGNILAGVIVDNAGLPMMLIVCTGYVFAGIICIQFSSSLHKKRHPELELAAEEASAF